MGVLDTDVPRRIEILRLLNSNRKEGLIALRYWKSLYAIYNYLGGDSNNTRRIINQFLESGIMQKNERGYFYDIGTARRYLFETVYAKCFIEHDMGNVIG